MSSLTTVANNVTTLQTAVKQSSDTNLNAYTNFLANYLNKQFLTNLVNCLVYQADLTLIAPSSNNIEIYKFLDQFCLDMLSELNIDNKDLTIPKPHYIKLVKFIREIVSLKNDVSYAFLSYDSLLAQYKGVEQFVKNVLTEVVDNQISDNDTFVKTFNSIIQDIQIYNQMKVVKLNVFKWDDFIRQSHEDGSNNSPMNWVKKFKDIIIEANSGLTELTVLKKNESVSDYLMFSDEESIKTSLKSILSFLKTSFRTYKTGYDLIDDSLSGIDSSSVTVISGPSNHSKSLFMINIAKQMMENNESEVTKDGVTGDDTFVFITLEDDINKLFRRILSIFGNYDNVVIKHLFKKSSEILQNTEASQVLGKQVIEDVEKLLENITKSSILSVTQGKKNFIIKHSSENSFSMSDANRFLETLNMSGYRVRGMFIDYIDVMIPSTLKNSKQFVNDEYVTQGLILHEMRTSARNHSIPIITITQNNRTSENVSNELSNNQIGDSVKKIRYSDNIFMIRQRPELDIFSEEVSQDINTSGKELTINDSSGDFLKHIVPFEVKITKAKDGEKGKRRFHLFDTKNLKIYQSITELIDDHKKCTSKSLDLTNQLSVIGIGADLDVDPGFNDDDPFENLIL